MCFVTVQRKSCNTHSILEELYESLAFVDVINEYEDFASLKTAPNVLLQPLKFMLGLCENKYLLVDILICLILLTNVDGHWTHEEICNKTLNSSS